MTSILNIFSNKQSNKQTSIKKISPSLKQGKKFKEYQNKIESSLEKNAEILSGKEGFSGMEDKSLTKQTDNIISNNNISSNQEQIINNLRQEYQNTIQQYEDLVNKISGNLTEYVDRINPNNPYLNKVVQFTHGKVCYVTSKGVVKWIPNMESRPFKTNNNKNPYVKMAKAGGILIPNKVTKGPVYACSFCCLEFFFSSLSCLFACLRALTSLFFTAVFTAALNSSNFCF